MLVKDLIKMLSRCPQDAEVVYYAQSAADYQWPDSVSPENSEGWVVIGVDLPPEMYARDYKD